METGPVFIGGLDRSGKTTLRGFLQSLPNLSIPAVGSNLWTYFYGQFGDLADPQNFERCLKAMLRYKQVQFLEPDPDRIRREFQQGPQTYPCLFALLQQHHAEWEGKPRWGDQSGLIERYADQIFHAYPDARMIQMIRDPRDRYAGSLELWPDGKGRAGGASARWLYTTQLARRNLKKYPERYFVLRFEDMVTDPDQSLRAVCNFLGEVYDSRILNMTGAPDQREKMIHRSHGNMSASPLSSEYIGIYRKQIPLLELAFMQFVLRPRMTNFGYHLDPINLNVSQRGEFYFSTVPLNLVRLASWLARESLQHHLPGLFGRKPGANMRVNPSAASTDPRQESAKLAGGE